MWELDYKENWAPKNWCFQTVVLEKTLESPLDCKEIKPIRPKGNQSWIFTERTDAAAESPIFLPPEAKNWLVEKDPDAGKDWRQEERGMMECEIVGWHYWLDGHELEQAPGSWWWTRKPGMLLSMGSQRAGQDWATELNWILIPCEFFLWWNLASEDLLIQVSWYMARIFKLGKHYRHYLSLEICPLKTLCFIIYVV